MILYCGRKDKVKIHCYKSVAPRIESKYVMWDCIGVDIDGYNSPFYFTLKNNRSRMYFEFKEQWYVTDIVQESGFDLLDYIENVSNFLSTHI